MTKLVILASKVNFMNGTNPGSRDHNNGGAAAMLVGGGITAFLCSGLLFFDLSGLDPSTVINSAVLSLWTAQAGAVVDGFKVYEIPAADVDWVEGVSAAVPEVGASCWNWHTYNTVAWSGGAGCLGGTYLGDIPFLAVQFSECQLVLANALVQAWVGPAGVNPGLSVKYNVTTAVRSYCSNALINAWTPRLTLDIDPTGVFFATGFEHQSLGPGIAQDQFSASITTLDYKTGVACLELDGGLGQGYIRMPVCPTLGEREEFYVGAYVKPDTDGGGGIAEIGIGYLASYADRLCVRWNYDGDGTYSFWMKEGAGVDTRLATSVTAHLVSAWRNWQTHFLADHVAGEVKLYVDEVLILTYNGDTIPGLNPTAGIVALRGTLGIHRFDDVVVADDDWPGLIRIDGLVLNSDISVEWEPLNPGTNYSEINEVPPDDADYVLSNVNAAEDVYAVVPWDNSLGGVDIKDPQFVIGWIRVARTAGAEAFKAVPFLVVDGVRKDKSMVPSSLTFTHEYLAVPVVATTPPSALVGLQLGLRAEAP